MRLNMAAWTSKANAGYHRGDVQNAAKKQLIAKYRSEYSNKNCDGAA